MRVSDCRNRNRDGGRRNPSARDKPVSMDHLLGVGGFGGGAVFGGWIEINSTSKIMVALGPMSWPAPRSPYARSGGMTICHFDPAGIISSAWVQPLIIVPPTGRVAFPPRLV